MKKYSLIVAAAGVSSIAGAQSMNIDFNWTGFGTLPTSAYGATGLPGVWNNANVSTNSISNLALVNLSGAATTALLNVASFGGNASGSGPWSGNDQALMEDLMGSGSNPVPVQLTGLLAGNYTVRVYGQAASGNLNSSFTINNNTLGTGGAWIGSHNLGGSYNVFSNVLVTGGNLTVNFTGNFNGMQLEHSPVPEPITILSLTGGLAAVIARRRRK